MVVVRLIAAFLVALPALASGEDRGEEQGREIVQRLCADCHAIGAEGNSPLAAAPAFRTLGQRFAIRDLEEALAEGIVTGHPEMPEFVFQPEEVDAIITYLESVQAH